MSQTESLYSIPSSFNCDCPAKTNRSFTSAHTTGQVEPWDRDAREMWRHRFSLNSIILPSTSPEAINQSRVGFANQLLTQVEVDMLLGGNDQDQSAVSELEPALSSLAR